MEKANPFQDNKQRFVGAYVPPPLADYLRLISMSEKKSISNLLQKMIEEKIEKNDESVIIAMIIEQAINEWERRAGSGTMKKRAYLKEIENELRRKKVSKRHISLILKDLQDRI